MTQKPLVVLLHGWGVDKTTLQGVESHIKTLGYPTVSFDFPGFGDAKEPDNPWNVSDYKNWTIHQVKEFQKNNNLRDRKIIFLGHSFGARVIIKIAAQNEVAPQDVKLDIEKVILTGAAGIKPIKTFKQKASEKVYKIRKKIGIVDPNAGSEDYRNASPLMKGTFVKVISEDLTPLLSMNPYETLLIWGEYDDATPLSDGEMMEKLMPDAGLAKINNAGHYAFLDQPQIFYAILDSYLS